MSGQYVSVYCSPENNTESVLTNTNIELFFSRPMEVSSVENKDKIKFLKGARQVPANYKYINKENKLVIEPIKQLLPGETYRIKILSKENGPKSNSILEINGSRVVKEDYNFIFTTKEDVVQSEPDKPKKETGEELNGEEGKTTAIEENVTEVVFDPLEQVTGNIVLESSFPEYGDLVELDSEMVLVFNKKINPNILKEDVFIKEANINPLLESMNTESLIKGTLETQDSQIESKNILFKPNQVLRPGTEYQLVVRKTKDNQLMNDIRINFQTLFERMFADVDTVRLVLGAFAERLTDLDLAKLINQQSNSIYQLASMMDSFNESDWAQENGVIVTFPYAAGQYVVYSTAYYAILGRSLEGSSGMSESIKLADLSVSGSSESSDNLGDLLELLKAEFERWWDVLQGKPEVIDPEKPNPSYKMVTTVRSGEEAPYPEFQKRVPFNDLGGRDS